MVVFQEVNKVLDYDVFIIGGGLSGIYLLLCMCEFGFRVRVIEVGEVEGGIWFW